MAASLVKNVLYRASVLLGDNSPEYTAFPERDMVSYLNQGQVSICKLAPWASSRVDAIKLITNQVRQTIASIASTDMIPMDGSAAVTVQGLFLTDLICNMGTAGATEGRAIRLVPRNVVNKSKPDWATIDGPGTSGGRVDQYIFDPRFPKSFWVLPRPVVTTWVLAAYQAMPVTITAGGAPGSEIYAFSGSSTTTITIDDRFEDDLVNYIVGRCLSAGGETMNMELANSFFSMFGASLKAHVEVMTAMNPNLVKS